MAAEGTDVNVQGVGGTSALHWAANNGHVDAARVLVKVGAELEASTADGMRPLHVAAHQGHVEVVTTLVELGADKEASDVNGGTPLHTAAYHGRVEVVTTLVELGADSALNKWRETPLQLSIRRGHHHVARVLEEVERAARIKKEAAAKKATQQAIDHAERLGALVIEEEEREEAQKKVRGCSILTLAELHGTQLDGVAIAHGLSAS
jgi:ankyrin repeat protein